MPREEKRRHQEEVFRRGGYGIGAAEESPAEPQVAHLVRARWVIVFILFIYAIYAGIFFSLSRFGFFLRCREISFLVLTLCIVVCYNLAYQKETSFLSRFRFADHLQVLLDLLLVTLLVHLTGGAVSWVWTLYLIVAMEAVYLLKRPVEVWIAWGASALFYGALLCCEHAGILSSVAMPFVDPVVRHERIFLLLIWFWVVILNAAVTAIGFHLMSVSRGETMQLKESRERLFAFLEHADDLIQLNAPDGRFIYANRAWLKSLGYEKGDLPRLNLLDLLHEDSREAMSEELKQVLSSAGGSSGKIDALYLSREGRVINMEGYLCCSSGGQEADAVWAICRDVTLKKRADLELYRMAHHDVLTDLPNRQLFMDRLQQLRGMMHRMQKRLAVLYLDLDHFKGINDSLGHGFGDKLLQSVALRLAGCVRETDTVARFGGDEFVIALGNLRDLRGAEKVAEKILGALSAPYLIESRELVIGCSIGISIYPDDGSELDQLVELADLALYRAKEEGRGCFRVHKDAGNEQG